MVRGTSLPISTKYAVEICRFIKKKTISDAINLLEQVLTQKKAIPMQGEYGHKKGKKIVAGKYPKKATEQFIRLLRSLSSNAITQDIENPVIREAIANFASRPLGRGGRWKRKRTHLKIIAANKKAIKKTATPSKIIKKNNLTKK